MPFPSLKLKAVHHLLDEAQKTSHDTQGRSRLHPYLLLQPPVPVLYNLVIPNSNFLHLVAQRLSIFAYAFSPARIHSPLKSPICSSRFSSGTTFSAMPYPTPSSQAGCSRCSSVPSLHPCSVIDLSLSHNLHY